MRSAITSRRVLFTGGGTAGHVYPLLAIAEALVDEAARSTEHAPRYEFLWIGSERSERSIVPAWSAATGIEVSFKQIDIRFSWRPPTPANWTYYQRNLIPLAFGRPFRQARAVLAEMQPHIVIGSGGYVSAPVLWAARSAGLPYCLLQLDAIPGLVNAQFCPGAWRIYASTMEGADTMRARCSGGKVVVAGFPSRRPRRGRDEVFAELGIDPGRRLLAVMGGSLGSGAIFRAARLLLDELQRLGPALAGQLVLLAIGGERGELASRHLSAASGAADRVQVVVTGYLEDSISVLAASDFYLGRSGGATVAELAALGLPALLIPDPQHSDRQQLANARVLQQRGQAVVVNQQTLAAPQLLDWLRSAWELPRPAPPAVSAAHAIARDLASRWGDG